MTDALAQRDRSYDPDPLTPGENVEVVLSGECKHCALFVPDSPTGAVINLQGDDPGFQPGEEEDDPTWRLSHPYVVILNRPLFYQADGRDGRRILIPTWVWAFARSELRRVEAQKTNEGTGVPLSP